MAGKLFPTHPNAGRVRLEIDLTHEIELLCDLNLYPPAPSSSASSSYSTASYPASIVIASSYESSLVQALPPLRLSNPLRQIVETERRKKLEALPREWEVERYGSRRPELRWTFAEERKGVGRVVSAVGTVGAVVAPLIVLVFAVRSTPRSHGAPSFFFSF
jgi:hypothetical protein